MTTVRSQFTRGIFTDLARLPVRLADLCYPRDCVACGMPAGENYRWLCEACAEKLPFTRAERCCETCGKPFEGAMAVSRRCPECEELKPCWTRGKTLLFYDGPGADVVRHLKYNGEKCLLDDIRAILRARQDVLDMLRGTILVPVPLHSGRLRERGYNQSEWLAELFAETSGASCQNLLKRLRDTGTQTALGREERRKNVRGAFALRGKVYPEQTYVLVDDVITTGATLNACALVLHKAGAKEQAVLTLAHA